MPSRRCVVFLFAFHGSALAQAGPNYRYVKVPQAEVRCGPSTDSRFYLTNRLPKGTAVEVVEELPGGWLKIRPPDGSFSYINTRFLEHITPNQPNFVVAFDKVEVPVYIGSEVVATRPTIIGAKLTRGAQVTSCGKAMSEDGETLMPIDAPHGEFRYIRSEEVSPTRPATGAVVTASRPTSEPVGDHSSFTPVGGPVPSSAPSANPPPSPDELWQRAWAAKNARQYADAIRLFNQASIEAAGTNALLATNARKWVIYLQGLQSSGTGSYAPAVPVSSAGSATGRTYPLASDPAPEVRLNPPLGSRSVWVEGTTTASVGRPAVAASVSGASRQLPEGWVAFHGRLRMAGRAVENVKTYVIEMEESGYVRPVAYVHAGQGVDLASQVGRVVEVWGPAVYRGDLRTNWITAMRVYPR